MGYDEIAKVGPAGAHPLRWMKEKRIWDNLGVRLTKAGDYMTALDETLDENGNFDRDGVEGRQEAQEVKKTSERDQPKRLRRLRNVPISERTN